MFVILFCALIKKKGKEKNWVLSLCFSSLLLKRAYRFFVPLHFWVKLLGPNFYVNPDIFVVVVFF